MTTIFAEVGPFAGDTEETIHYRSCDFCFESATDDIWAGRLAESEWRLFYEVLGECGLICCENCLPRLSEEQA
jgi:hypothetical protein